MNTAICEYYIYINLTRVFNTYLKPNNPIQQKPPKPFSDIMCSDMRYLNGTGARHRRAKVHQRRGRRAPNTRLDKRRGYPPIAGTLLMLLGLGHTLAASKPIGFKRRAGRPYTGIPPRHRGFHFLRFRDKEINPLQIYNCTSAFASS